MDVRAQLVMVFNLDKCVGCHTCSIACKNIWTDRKGAEYMWWNNVETKPGAGFPKFWEDQGKYRGGGIIKDGKVKLRAFGKLSTLMNIFYQPYMPKLEDYYHPWTYDYGRLYDSEEEDDQPVAEPVSLISGERMDNIESGPNWDDDLGGSNEYAAGDANLLEKEILEEYEKIFMFYLPRICNHCLNPACIAACPSRAIYKRGEDGIVLVDQNTCRGWRFCVTACPYKKVYYNWNTGKSEKCIFCYPRTETGQANACAHSCVGRIRYVGVLLYDADRVSDILKVRDEDLVEAQRDLILNPEDDVVRKAARENGIPENWVQSAVDSPVYTLVKEFGIALPLHPEFRTLPMTYYVPPLSPVLLSQKMSFELDYHKLIPAIGQMRIPLKYLAKLFTAGNVYLVAEVLKKLVALRVYMRAKTVGDTLDDGFLREVSMDANSLDRLYRLFTTASYEKRYSIPPVHGEYVDSYERKGGKGFGIIAKPRGGI